MKKIIALLLAAVLAAGCACALAAGSVAATGSVNLRTGPGLDYDKQTAVHKGTELEYLGETVADERGVDWYKVEYEGEALWISSRYAELKAAEAAPAQAEPVQPEVTTVPDLGDEGGIELSDYYLTELSGAAKALNLTQSAKSDNSPFPNRWYSDALLIAGGKTVKHFGLTGEGYSVYGVSVGMHVNAAKALLTAAGLAPLNGIGVIFDHPSGKNSPVSIDGADSYISVTTDPDGIVTGIIWSTYLN